MIRFLFIAFAFVLASCCDCSPSEGCADSSPSDNSPSGSYDRMCYDKYLAYSDVAMGAKYNEYYDDWQKGACTGFAKDECISYNADFTLKIHECIENVTFE